MNTKQLSPADMATLFKAAELHTFGRTSTCDFYKPNTSIVKTRETQKRKYQLVQNLIRNR